MSKKIRQPFEIPYDNILDITKDKVSKHRGLLHDCNVFKLVDAPCALLFLLSLLAVGVLRLVTA